MTRVAIWIFFIDVLLAIAIFIFFLWIGKANRKELLRIIEDTIKESSNDI